MRFPLARLVASIAAPLVAACTAGSPPAPTGSARASASVAVVTVPAPPDVADGIVTVVDARADVALEGPRVEAKHGDWMIRGGGAVAIVSAEDGRVIDYGAEGHADGLGYVDSVVFDGLDRANLEVQSIEALVGDGRVVHVTKRVLDRPLELHTWTWLEGGNLRIDSMMIATGPKPVLAVTLGEIYRWGNTITWVEGHGFVDHGGSFGADFIARDSQGVAYAARSLDGAFVVRLGSPDLPGFHAAPRTGEAPLTLQPGEWSTRRRIAVSYSGSGIGAAATALGGPALEKAVKGHPPKGAPKDAAIEVAHCDPPIESWAKLAPADAPDEAKPAPRVDAPKRGGDENEAARPRPSERPVAHAPWARFAANRDFTVPAGCFVARVVAPGEAPGPYLSPADLEKGGEAALPVAGTLEWTVTEKGSPIPSKLVVRGLDDTDDPDWGDDGVDGASVNGVYSADGKGSEPIPPGRYHVFLGRGPEYTLHEEDIDVAAGKTVKIEAKLERVVDTTGWISADLHVHAIPSFDAPVRLVDRMRSLAGVGVEVGVATDHNRITDYGPAIQETGLEPFLAHVVGDEITSEEVDFGHFNAFPLRPDAEPPATRSVVPKDLFAEMRAAGAPGGPIVLQVNHPRMDDIGYFDLLRLDPEDIDGSIARSTLWATDFDAIEVFNGDHYADVPKVERAMMDWYALLAAGRRVTATGNSDSHKVTYQEAGEPRNWVAVPDDDPAHFDERAFIEGIRAGRVVVSNGPFVTMTAGGKSIGDTVPAGDVEITIDVQAPPWIDVSRVELVDRGHLVRTFDGPFDASAKKRFSKTFTFPAKKGDFLVAVVRGEKPMKWLTRKKAAPFGFTNPIWVE